MARIVTTARLDDEATGEQTGTVGEPSIAASGARVLMTGNWYATRSTDGGDTWTFVDPFAEFPPAAGGLCCDQVVHYSRTHRIWIWILQYSSAARTNVFRVAASRTGAQGTWTWWDVAPADVDPAWRETWFDYPDIAQSSEHLFVSFNMFNGFDRWQRAVVFRFPLAELADRDQLTRRHWSTTEVGSLRFVRGADDVMWFAGHGPANETLTLCAWDDGETDPVRWDVAVQPWNDLGYAAAGSSGADWLGRLDGRITGAWRSRDLLGFAWTAAPEPGRTHPFIRVVRFDEATLDPVDQPDLWSENGAYAYVAVSPNRRGDVGLTAYFGGPTAPAHVVADLDERQLTWRPRTTVTSTHRPALPKWGDYLTIGPDPRRRTYWTAAGYTLQDGRDRRNVEPLVVTFKP
jgi:hypothetical protein